MSYFESLLPYLTEKKEEKPLIIVDSHEATSAPKVIKSLQELGAETRVEALQRGDYVISDSCAIERKEIRDYVHTLTRRYLFEQLFELKEAYPKPILLIEGYLPIIYKFSKIRPSAIWGSIFALIVNGIFVTHTTNYKETAEFIYTAARYEQFIEKRLPTIRPFKKVESLADAQLFLMCGLPSIGIEKAKAILRGFESPLNAFLRVDEWDRVEGIGPVIKKKAKEVLTTQYSESETK